MAEEAEEDEAQREPDAAPEPVRGVTEPDGGIDAEGSDRREMELFAKRVNVIANLL